MKKVLAVAFAISMLAGIAAANDGHGGAPGGPGFGPEGGFIVGSDGTVYLSTTTVASGAATTALKAVRASGAVAWTVTVNGRGDFTLSDGNLLSVSDSTTNGTVTSTITAISTATGATAWTRNLNGRVHELRPFTNGTYAITVVPATTTGGTPTRTLTAIGNDGSILWTLAL
jgi:hypothetical protein